MVSIADVKLVSTIGQSASGDDVLIGNKLNFAYAYIGSMCTLSLAGSGEEFKENFDFEGRYSENHNEFDLQIRSDDIALIAVKAFKANWDEETIDLTTIKKIGGRRWFITGGAHYKGLEVRYSSVKAKQMLEELVKDVAVFEIAKQLTKTGAITSTGKSSGQVVLNFKTEKDFYDEIKLKMATIVYSRL